MAVFRTLYPLLFYFLVTLRKSDAAVAPKLLALYCSTDDINTNTETYIGNLNQLLADLPKNTVSNHGGFFNGTVGEDTGTVYGLAMCSADFSRADCRRCLTAASSSDGGLTERCRGSAVVAAVFDQCMIRYSYSNFFGTVETDIVFKWSGANAANSSTSFGYNLKQSLANLSLEAAASLHRFAASARAPYALVQCTWDLSPEDCKACIDALSANATSPFQVPVDGELKSYSCRVRYCNSSFTVVPFAASSSETENQTSESVEAPSTYNSPPDATSGTSNIGVVVGSVLAAAIVIASCVCCFRCIKRRQHFRHQRLSPDTEVNSPREFKHAELSRATDNFSRAHILGKGAFGVVFRGKLEKSGASIAVKKILYVDEKARDDYVAEIKATRQLRHKNIVHLMGWCDENDDELLLVYELMENGALSSHLHPPTSDEANQPSREPLDWKKRHKIILGIASGLCYLHDGSDQGIIHRDIKPDNILLDGSFKAKLGDFGLVRLVDHEKTARTMTVNGTLCYMDPDYMNTKRASKESDVYSFGVVLLEILCGEKPTLEGHINTLIWKVRDLHAKNQILQALDRSLEDVDRDLMKNMLWIGLLCVRPDHHYRPTSTQVLAYLRKGPVPEPPCELYEDVQASRRSSISGHNSDTQHI